MKPLDKLRQEAEESTKWRGHTIKWVAPWHGEGKSTQLGECPNCGMEVQICTKPAPNGIDIGGRAVALNCK